MGFLYRLYRRRPMKSFVKRPRALQGGIEQIQVFGGEPKGGAGFPAPDWL
jgi:hypothetical protein